MHLMFYLMMFALKYEHVGAVEGAPDGSYHFKKHKQLQKQVKKKIHLTLQSRVPLWISNFALYTSFIYYKAKNKQNCWNFQIRVQL